MDPYFKFFFYKKNTLFFYSKVLAIFFGPISSAKSYEPYKYGIITVVLTGLFTGHYWGGFAWRSNPSLQFNWHPFLMTIGMIYLYGNGK